ncbi:MAG TPA: NAD(P)-binding domain-containing protein [Pyrinomonadaceae bacterium]|nr:NAD(P)-binding domain-containing protein [Pyrinomonadaceae bacterium]
MRKTQLLIIIALLALLLAINRLSGDDVFLKGYFGGLPWYGWAGISAFFLLIGVGLALSDAARARFFLEKPPQPPPPEDIDLTIQISPADLERLDPSGPSYPHPVIFPERCIFCHACVDACPHDVLSMVNNIATPVAPDQCLEDTSCQLECPVNPKACIVVNTTKKIRPRPVPVRNEKFMTNVEGCYIIGDVSGTPLIKNAANEGADVVRHIAQELGNGTPSEPKAELDVAVIGIGVAGLSAALMAKKCDLSFVGIEQDRVLATIDAYPKGKYVFLKPETMEWRGAIEVPGIHDQREQLVDEALMELLSAKDETDADVLVSHMALMHRIIEALFKKADKVSPEQRDLMLIALCEAIVAELCETPPGVEQEGQMAAAAVVANASGELPADISEIPIEQRKMLVVELLEQTIAPVRGRLGDSARLQLVVRLRERIMGEMRKKIAGEQREEMLETWLNNMRSSHVQINEGESCQSVKKAGDGDYFIIETERGAQKERATYRARRVVLAIGNRGTPMRLGVEGEDMKITRDEQTTSKVMYKLSNPEDFKRRRIVIVGGGNSAIEAAVDLVARREGDQIIFSPDSEINDVTLVVRSDFKNDLKFGNTLQIYQCIDEGRIRARFGEAIKEIRDDEVVLLDART